MSLSYISIAIDGPSGAGKSTIAKAAAKRLGYIYLDTGALYRAVGLYMLRQGIDIADQLSVGNALGGIEIELKFKGGRQRVILCGSDVSEAIRDNKVSKAASDVSAYASVREFLFSLQRDFAENTNVVMDGRDIGTSILPQAQVKIFLTASDQARAKRRYKELVRKGQQVEYDDILEEMRQRDKNDMTRSASPLKQAEDAILIDTTENDLEQSIEVVMQLIKRKLNL
ncbi:MAG: (d)CMP kinase [Oscillospiraceae bacterium]|nr:(d)CMP kinase [Oscillospiraceae bacterium]